MAVFIIENEIDYETLYEEMLKEAEKFHCKEELMQIYRAAILERHLIEDGRTDHFSHFSTHHKLFKYTFFSLAHITLFHLIIKVA